MKKLIVAVVAFAAFGGVAFAGERDHDSRLDNPNYSVTGSNFDAGSRAALNAFSADRSVTAYNGIFDNSRLDEKNGSRG
jgi:hypothetical protein